MCVEERERERKRERKREKEFVDLYSSNFAEWLIVEKEEEEEEEEVSAECKCHHKEYILRK